MIKKKSNLNYIFIVLLSVFSFFLYNRIDLFYEGSKYITTYRTIDIMMSILFIFLFFKCFLDNYYYYVLNRNNIIVRYGKKKYILYIIKKILTNMLLLFLVNLIIDFILLNKINLLYNLINTVLISIIVIILPKRKEYNYELLISMAIVLIVRLIAFSLFFYGK